MNDKFPLSKLLVNILRSVWQYKDYATNQFNRTFLYLFFLINMTDMQSQTVTTATFLK